MNKKIPVNCKVKIKNISSYLSLLLLLAIVSYQFIYLPWNLTWGASDEEVNQYMIGDDILKEPEFNATRAVTINTSPENIWPWIVQIGYKKGGFYSYDFLDNYFIPSANRIILEYQDLKVGEYIHLSKNSTIIVAAMEHNKYLLLGSKARRITWVWELNKINKQQSRLVARLRAKTNNVLNRLFWETFEIFMMRKHLLGIKFRAENFNENYIKMKSNKKEY